jgi:hypothetical protein
VESRWAALMWAVKNDYEFLVSLLLENADELSDSYWVRNPSYCVDTDSIEFSGVIYLVISDDFYMFFHTVSWTLASKLATKVSF